jgi:deoxycytidine triphosphate deaminase/addiction module HigA family antidote
MLHQERGASPGASLRAEIERLGLDQVAVADATGVSRQTINNIVNDRQPISRSMAAKLGRLTGRSSDYWLRSQFPSADAAPPAAIVKGAVDTPAFADAGGIRGVGILVNHQIIRAVREGTIDVDPFTERNVQRASIDLTLDDFIFTTDGNSFDISGGQNFTLQQGQAVSVRTREWIKFPIDYAGRVGAIGNLAKFGIILSHGLQVDPGFKGQLWFCVFNAGGATFQLRGGDPIISLEIMPLSSVPSAGDAAGAPSPAFDSHADFASRFGSPGGAGGCERLIHDQIRQHVKVDDHPQRVTARISELDIEIVESSNEAASAAAVASALQTLSLLRAHRDMQTELNDKYETFFNQLIDRVCLSGEQARGVIARLGLPFQDPGRSIIKLRTGKIAMLQLPVTSARITLKALARQLHIHAHDVVLALSRP